MHDKYRDSFSDDETICRDFLLKEFSQAEKDWQKKIVSQKYISLEHKLINRLSEKVFDMLCANFCDSEADYDDMTIAVFKEKEDQLVSLYNENAEITFIKPAASELDEDKYHGGKLHAGLSIKSYLGRKNEFNEMIDLVTRRVKDWPANSGLPVSPNIR